ncbi:Uncharacterised protein [Bordetella pertussis]|nr:Uncharacterised protein [Bordetella pertussis]CFW30415.1 Uncharacterised protein [Bordetella pertussis]
MSSHRSMSSTVRPWRSSSLGTASTGPIPISCGSHPTVAKPRNTPSGSRPRRAASRPDIRTQAAAPSDNWLALPAVTNCPSPRTGANRARLSSEVSGRAPSSRAHSTCRSTASPVAGSIVRMVVRIGAISCSNLPASCAAAVRRWLRNAYSSWASREIP